MLYIGCVHEIIHSLLIAGDEVSAAKLKLILSTDGKITRYGWTRGDGRFRIPNVPAGPYLLEVSAINMMYPQVQTQFGLHCACYEHRRHSWLVMTLLLFEFCTTVLWCLAIT